MKKLMYAVMLLLSLSMMTVSCDNIGKNNLEGYEWLEGEWVANYTKDDYRNDLYDSNDMWNLSRSEIEEAVDKFQGPQMFKVIIDKKHIRYELPGELTDINKKHDYQIAVVNPNYNQLMVDGNHLLSFYHNNSEFLIYHSVFNEYEVDVYLKKKVVENKPKEDSKAADAKEEDAPARKKKTSNSNSMEKEFKKAFENKECIYFRTNYVAHHDFDRPSFYMVLYPFVFSDNGLRGIMYIVTYGTQQYDGREKSSLCYWGEYEVVGNYLRLTNIEDLVYKKHHRPKIYKINQIGGNLQLEGQFLEQDDATINVQEQQPIPEIITSLINNKFCLHK